ncbi:MAG: ATP-binding protein [Prevotellaceae bacterium]|jgi:predicted AAA+ superfamily ATPase|nr:ATP-binding protein [Prevotellaceae bacterium]
MYRIKIKSLIDWKLSKSRKPLIVQGARQVGKTWLIKEFGKTEFRQTVYINFENETQLQNIFLQDLNPQRIISTLEAFFQVKIDASNTLIVFDEIQSATKGLTALKYFCEDAPEYFVIASDSLLGMNLHNKVSFPVGKVSFLYLYPMNFYEFLLAMGEKGLAQILEKKQWDMLPVFKEYFKEKLKYYFFIGGMPEVVVNFVENRDWQQVRIIQNQILNTYENDFSKHAPYEIIPRLNMVWDSIPAQLAKENKKFVYGVAKEGARAKDFELAIQWLVSSGILLKTFRISKPSMPLIAYQDMSAFKLFFNDVGLLAAKSRLDAKTLVDGNALFEEYKGALTEQFVMQQLKAAEIDYIGYWTNEKSTNEVDFVIQHEGEITPIEVKAAENLQAKSFKFFYEKYKPQTAIRASLSDYRKETWLTNVPLYIIGNYFNNHL